jgi:F-type H+-transporting ATPase subunit b
MHYAPLIGFNWTFVMVLITFLVLYLILKKYFFQKVRDFMLAREQKVKDSFDNVDAITQIAESRLAEYNQLLEEMDSKRKEALQQAKKDADNLSQGIIGEAEERASKIISKAQAEIEREKEKSLADMRQQISLLAVYAAEKIIESNLDQSTHQAIIDGVLKEAGGAEWKN